MEHLKQIEDYPDYFVSDQGEVYSKKRSTTKKLKVFVINTGYLGVNLKNASKRKLCLIHRLVAQAFVPNPENKPCVNHLDGNKQNNNANNLEWTTHQENTQYFYDIQKPNGVYNKPSEEIKAYAKRWHEKHREEIKAYAKRWRDKHREEINARAKQYREKRKAQQKSHN